MYAGKPKMVLLFFLPVQMARLENCYSALRSNFLQLFIFLFTQSLMGMTMAYEFNSKILCHAELLPVRSGGCFSIFLKMQRRVVKDADLHRHDRHFVRGNAVVKDTDLHRHGSNTYNSFRMSFTLGLFL